MPRRVEVFLLGLQFDLKIALCFADCEVIRCCGSCARVT